MEITGRNVVIALLAFGAMLATVAYFGKPVVRLRPRTPIAKPTLAILPFENLDGGEALEVLAADATAAITEALAATDDYEVVPRTTALQHKGLKDGIESIAATLGADYALAGSVERDDGRLRVSVYVVMPGERPRIWADEFFYSPEDHPGVAADLVGHVRAALAAE